MKYRLKITKIKSLISLPDFKVLIWGFKWFDHFAKIKISVITIENFFVDRFQIRFDFLDFDISSDPATGYCIYDTFNIMNSPDGPGGRICGSKNGYATVTRPPRPGKDLGLSVVVQGPAYKWNIKISQIRCDQVRHWKTFGFYSF